MASYLILKRALGRKYKGEEQTLRHLDRFVARRFPAATDLSLPILDTWLTKGCHLQPRSRATHLTRVRQFCLFRRRTLSCAFVPDRLRHRLLWPNHISRRAPLILSREQIRELLCAARELPGAPENGTTFFRLFLLLYTTGLRRSEATRLKIGDVDLDQGTLLVRETKFFKTRLVPVARPILAELRCQIDDLRRARRYRAEQPLFQTAGKPVGPGRVSALFTRLMRDRGMKPVAGRCGPRLHDLRGTFAVHRIERWYAQGADVQSRLPALATYMGHKNIISTQYYVTATAELLQHAARRFERACAPGGGR